MSDDLTTHPTAIHPDDADDEWSQRPARRGIRLHLPTAILLTLLVLAGGFWGGAVAEKHHNGSPSSNSALSALANRFAAARGATGTGTGSRSGRTGSGGGLTGGAGGLAGAATAGIVTGVQGDVLYVTDASGNLIKVTIGPSTTVTRTAKSNLAGLQTGDTVVVSGTTAANGSVTATAVRASGQGVAAAGAGGLGGATNLGGAGG